MTVVGQYGVVARIGTTQTLAWASTYYLPAMLAAPLATDLGLPITHVFGAFTLALVVSALVGPRAGRALDDWGGRTVLSATSVLFAAGLAALGMAQTEWQMWVAWALIGVGMGSGLYDAAFSAVVRLYPVSARTAITGITLVAGFASTVGWPLTAWWIESLGWRGTCFAWAGFHLLLGLPLHLSLPKVALESIRPVPQPVAESLAPQAGRLTPRWMMGALAIVFAITWFTSTAMAAHLPMLLQMQGLTASAALGIAMLVGPAQVIARVLEFGLLHHIHPLHSARLAAAAHPLGVLAIVVFGPAAAWVFVSLHGAGNGVLTISKGTLPLVVFGPAGYGERQGWLMAPARFAQAAAPALFGLAITHWGGAALWLTAGLGLATVFVLQGMAASWQRQAVRHV
jgi:MFS family permease